MNYQALYQALIEAKAETWANLLPNQLAHAFTTSNHGHVTRWQHALDQLALMPSNHKTITTDAIQIGLPEELPADLKPRFIKQLQEFMPWRKGPYHLFGVEIDTEWRSDWKWLRLKDHITPLKNRRVLDVGCGNGYHCWRMLGEEARLVIGIDPFMLNVMQFQVIRKLYGETPPIYVLPMGLEALPPQLKCFDTVFSMGVLYHRRSPIDHLLELKDCLRPGGELVLETLIIDGEPGATLMPEDRYAKMRNVWFIPGCETLLSWLKRCGFRNARVVNVCTTTTNEQRTTAWMPQLSLKEFLNPDDASLTCEGYPAPKRAIVIANTD